MTELSPTGVINDLPKLDDNEFPISQTSDKVRSVVKFFSTDRQLIGTSRPRNVWHRTRML